ncbi:MAG TPA: metallopeptidase TldD-related protein [Allosphingosinicella sp.]|nr:metallopeptidase TldD-related protein [Allosphingosinicella sp.]
MRSGGETIVGRVLDAAKAAGADSADALFVSYRSLEAAVREGVTENIERAEGEDLGLRVFVGESQAIVSMSAFDADTLSKAAERAVAMAKVAPPDPYAGLADSALLAKKMPSLDLADATEPDEAQLLKLAVACEAAALGVAGITKSAGAGASTGRRGVVLGSSAGFLKSYERTGYGFSVAAVAGDGVEMERDYAYSSAVHFADLKPPEEVGQEAGGRAIKRLKPRKVASQSVPVVFDPRVASGLVAHLAGAISGPAIARGTSFLKDMLGKAVFSPGIIIVDDPHIKRGLGSRPFDAEGVRTARREFVSDGVLMSWMLDHRSARQLGLTSTGNASRGTSSPPSPSTSNLYMANGTASPDALMAEIGSGLYVTELMGSGVNGVTGDYSRGATGFWIENGKLTYPVSEITIAGNLKDMYRRLTPANDLEFKSTINAPTVRIEDMTVAGA